MSADLLTAIVLNGLVTGMIYALMGVGLSVILGLLNVPNFAHGALYAIGAYLVVWASRTGLGFWLGLIIAPLAVAVLGALIEVAGIRRLYRVHPDYTLLFTFAMSLILTESVILLWGPVGGTFQPPAVLAGSMDVLGLVRYPRYRIAIMLCTGLVVLGCWLLVEKTRYGAIIRAGIEDKDMASALGIDIFRVFTVAFAVGTGFAGLAGALMLPVRGFSPSMGLDILPFAFVVVVLGGLGSLSGAIVAGLLVGIVQSVMTVLWSPGADMSVFALMSLGIVLRPQGLFGKR